MTKQKRSKKEEQSVEEKTTLHGKRTETLAPCIVHILWWNMKSIIMATEKILFIS